MESVELDIDFVGAFDHEYGWIVYFSRIIMVYVMFMIILKEILYDFNKCPWLAAGKFNFSSSLTS